MSERVLTIRHRDPVDSERHRRTLFGVAYRMLGSADDAEDIVQDAWIRYARVPEPESPRAYLIAVVTRLCVDYLKSARVRREQYAGPWLPEPLATGEYASSPEQRIAEAESVSYAFMVLLERLSPLERAVFVLHDVLDYGHDEIADALGRSAATCRQLLPRARRHLRDGESRYRATARERIELTQRFLAAAAGRDVAGFVALLTADAVLTSDGGGKVAAAVRPVLGPERIALFLSRIGAQATDPAARVIEVNGAPAILVWDGGELIAAFMLEPRDGAIAQIYVMRNPDKLARLSAFVPPDLAAHSG